MKIEWTKKALKQRQKLPESIRAQLREAVRELASWPQCRNVKPLKGRSDYRLRVGNYRVIFEVDTSIRVILITEVAKRNERTYQ